MNFIYPHPRTLLLLLLKREEGREGEREMWMQERSMDRLPQVLLPSWATGLHTGSSQDAIGPELDFCDTGIN